MNSRLLSASLGGLLTLSLALGAASCGDDDGSGSGSAGSESSTVVADGTTEHTPEQRAKIKAEAKREAKEVKASTKAAKQAIEGFAEVAQRPAASSPERPSAETLKSAADDKVIVGVCNLLSEQAKRQTIEYARHGANIDDVKWTCENATALLVRRSNQGRDPEDMPKVEVVGTTVEGNRATASIKRGEGPITSISLVKEDGKWKLASTPGG